MTQPAISLRERADVTATSWVEIGHARSSAAASWAGSVHVRAEAPDPRLPADPAPAQADAFRRGSP